VFDVVLLDIVELLPYEPLFIMLALLAPLELYVFMLLLEDPVQAKNNALKASSDPKAMIFFID